jgi:2-amino-4-hydroxy-6-hydroxymethyldihydropteridine diphosphokinase
VNAWFPAYVGLGSNLEDPVAQLRFALQRLAQLAATRLVARSPLYRTRPFGPVVQPDFVNAAAGLLTQQDAPQLLRSLRAIERDSGRPARHERWGPRTLDLDLLVYADQRRDEVDLKLPHPGIAERNFVLYPLADIAPQLDVPGLGRVAALRARVSGEGIWPLVDD